MKYNIYRSIRQIRNITSGELAEMLETSNANISSIETGRSNPSKRLLRDWCKVMKVPITFIVEHKDIEVEDNVKFPYTLYLYIILKDLLQMEKENNFNI